MHKAKSKPYKVIMITLTTLVLGIAGTLMFTNIGQVFVIMTVGNYIETTDITVEGNTLTLDGYINARTPEQVRAVFEQNPQIDTVLMKEVEGSIDDISNLEIATWLSRKNLRFRLNSDSVIASGGTDFFLAGKTREVPRGAKVGVHSWSHGQQQATDFEVGHEAHQRYIDFYIAIGWSREQAERFYYFTINAAPADEIHWMSEQELLDYRISTSGGG